MEKEITLPAISEGDETGIVNDIYVKEGDTVEAEQSIIAVESDKATVDVPVENGGVIKSIKVKEGDEIKTGDSIIVLDIDDQDQGDSDESKGQEEQKNKSKEEVGKSEDDKPPSAENDTSDDENGEEDESSQDKEEENKKEEKSPSADKDVPAAPLARKFARELGIDIHDLMDEPDERVTRQDILKYARDLIEHREEKSNGDHRTSDLPDFSKWGETDRQPMSGIRRETAKSTVKSWQAIPHVTHHDKADITELEIFRKKNERSETKITVTAILLRIIGEALRKFPQFNTSLDMAEKEIVYKNYFHVGVAVDTQNGLLLPVIKDVVSKSIFDLTSELSTVANKARNGELTRSDMQGGNFVISNLGGIGGTSFTPVIFPPQVAILGVSRSEYEPVYNGEEFVPRRMLPLSLSYDHRVIDGADAARFSRWICEVLKHPMNLILE